MGCEYEGASDWYKGFRSVESYRPDSIKKAFEKIIGKKITKWDHAMNGRFQYTTPADLLVYHADGQNLAAVIYLNPDAPYRCGTEVLTSHKEDPWAGGNFDKTKFEVVDAIGNVYNRVFLFGDQRIHAASEYFGKELQDSRLVHLFFFDTE